MRLRMCLVVSKRLQIAAKVVKMRGRHHTASRTQSSAETFIGSPVKVTLGLTTPESTSISADVGSPLSFVVLRIFTIRLVDISELRVAPAKIRSRGRHLQQ